MATEPKKNITPLLFLLMLALALFVDLSGSWRRKGEMVGKAVADFDIPELGRPGSHFSPRAWAGKIAIVNIFASWCEPCRAEFPLLIKLSHATSVPIYGIAWRDKEDRLKGMLESEGNPFTEVALDEDGEHVKHPFGVIGIPETYIIDKNGIVAYHYLSSLDEDEIENGLMPVLNELTGNRP